MQAAQPRQICAFRAAIADQLGRITLSEWVRHQREVGEVWRHWLLKNHSFLEPTIFKVWPDPGRPGHGRLERSAPRSLARKSGRKRPLPPPAPVGGAGLGFAM